MVAEVRGQTGNPLQLEPLYSAIGTYNVEILFVAPALIAAARGRRYLKSILLGRLSLFGTLGIGVGTGCACILFSSFIDLSSSHWPVLHLEGLWHAFGFLPITAYLLGPFGEEMLYQVGLQTWLQRLGPVVALLGATVPFWGYHLYGGFVSMHDALFFLLPSFLAYAALRQISKSYGAAVLAHSAYNILVSSLSYAPR